MWKQAISRLEQDVINTLWAQWPALGGMATAVQDRRARSIIDPEALVLASLTFRDQERRLWDLLGWAATEAATLFSVQRMRNLASSYPPHTLVALEEFAALAHLQGGDHRWRSMAGAELTVSPRSEKLKGGPVQLIEDSTLWMRLRLGIGVGIKADILALLLGHKGALIIRDIAAATGYTPAAVRRAADELSEARFIRCSRGHPAEYAVDTRRWLGMLAISRAPRWHYWQQIFAFSAHLSSLRNRLIDADASSYVASSELRRITNDHSQVFDWNGLRAPESDRYPGEEFLGAFADAVDSLGSWMRGKI